MPKLISLSVEPITDRGPVTADAAGADFDHLQPGSSFRVAPMLASVQTIDDALIVVGQVRIVADTHGTVRLTPVVRGLWVAVVKHPRSESDAARGWRSEPVFPHGAQSAIEAWVRDAAGQPLGVAAGAATSVAKGIAEASRNSVERARALRYALELRLSATIRGTYTESLDVVLADLVELSVIAGRARDEARESLREGLWAWRTDPGVYHAQRRLRDPSLPARAGDRAARRVPWFSQFDAAVRHSERTEQLLGEEIHLLQGLLNAASAIATARDAQAQERFTLTATVGGVALGIPALIIGLYGVGGVLPLHFDQKSLHVVAPLAIASLLACLLAYATTPGTWARRFRFTVVTFVAVIVLTACIAAAGYFFPLLKGS